jgi:transposase InsO family protein
MDAEEKMTIDERYKYLRLIRSRYRQADRRVRTQLLDEMETLTGLHRKSLIRLINGPLKRRPRCRQRGAVYRADFDDALRVIAETADYICAERLTPGLVQLADHLEAHGELTLSEGLRQQLGCVSISTVRRRLNRIRQDEPRLPSKKRRWTPSWHREIPAKRISWKVREPGYFEADLVHHSGPDSSGEFVCTLQMIDVATGWSERAAILGRSYLVMEDAFRRILHRLPFPVREVHSDNGSEFFTNHLRRFWGDLVRKVELSRSRLNNKNDNRFVEQKNSTLVRAYLGVERLDTVDQTIALNLLYDQMWLYYNFFQPVMRLQEKTYVPASEGKASRVKRRYDKARTPFDRLCETDALLPEHRAQLEALRAHTNPRRLRQEIYDGISQLFCLPGAVEGQPQDVRETLYTVLGPSKESPVTLSFDRMMSLR